MKTVGVLGGMGPAATIDFFARIVAATPAARDQDHLHLIIDNNPQVPDRNAAIAGHFGVPVLLVGRPEVLGLVIRQGMAVLRITSAASLSLPGPHRRLG